MPAGRDDASRGDAHGAHATDRLQRGEPRARLLGQRVPLGARRVGPERVVAVAPGERECGHGGLEALRRREAHGPVEVGEVGVEAARAVRGVARQELVGLVDPLEPREAARADGVSAGVESERHDSVSGPIMRAVRGIR